MVSVARRTLRRGSRLVTNRVTPFATAPRTMRRTIEVLSSSVDEPALATTRRTSLPERGLTMSPIPALFDKIGDGIGEMGEVIQPRTDVGSGSVGGAPRQRPHLALAAPAAEYSQQFERLGFEHQPH